MQSYLKFERKARRAGLPSRFVRSEDLILDQHTTIAGIADWLGVDLTLSPDFANDTKHRSRTLNDLKRYYGEERWRLELDSATIDHIAAVADPTLTARFGYSV